MRTLLGMLRMLVCVITVPTVWEVCARIDDYITEGASPLESYNLSVLYTDDALGIRGRPHAHYLKWKLNSLGYRGPDLVPGRIRVACLGSSETFGSYEAEGNEYPRQLERELNSRKNVPGVDVVNASYPGMRLPTMLRRLPELVEEVQPSIVIIYPSLAAYIYKAPASDVMRAPSTSAFEPRIVERMRTLLVKVIPPSIQTRMKELLITRTTRHWNLMERVPESHASRFRMDLDRLINAVLAHGARPVLVTHATRFGSVVTPDEYHMLVAWRKFYPILIEEGFLDMEQRLNAIIRQVAADRHLPLVDAARRMPTGPRYYGDFVHFTDEGAGILARMLAEEVEPLLDASALSLTRGSGEKPE